MFYVYILISLRDGKFYIGFTANLRRRFFEHQTGKSRSTKSRRPFVLMYYEAHLSKFDAYRRERYFKTNKGKSSLRQMIRGAVSGKI